MSCWLEQLLKQDWLATLLPVPVAELDDVLGTTQPVWQVAACELQLIMQLVVAELCASRIDLVAFAADAAPLQQPISNATTTIRKTRTSASSIVERGRQDNSSARPAKRASHCRTAATHDPARKSCRIDDANCYAVRM